MSYQDKSDKDHLDIILGPPAQEKLIESVHSYASTNNVSIDEAWSECIRNTADNLMKPMKNGFNSFSNIFTDILKEEVYVEGYFLSHYYHCFSTNGQMLRRMSKEERHEYTAPTLNFSSKNLLDGEGNPIDIRRFDTIKRQLIQNIIIYHLDVSWAHVTISYGYSPVEKIKT
ncbi:hypothetical protein N8477_03990 [Candidatus Thioglobus sp.]|nr:hypothetical protein [Candidatus Thioglobus sp.]